MIRKIGFVFIAAIIIAAGAPAAFAQDVLMNSAETINQGNLKLAVFPTMLFGKNGESSLWGVAGRFGYGITDSLDIEAKAAFFKGLQYFGADIEYWFVHGRNFNVSAAVGGHMTNGSGMGDSSGLDTALMASTSPVEHLEIYGGLKLAFDSLKNGDFNYTLAHFVPGIEYRLSADLDFLAEVGIALNDRSRSYVSVGLSLYLLR